MVSAESLVKLCFLVVQCTFCHLIAKVLSYSFYWKNVARKVKRWYFSWSNSSNDCLTFSSFSDDERNCPEFTDLNIGNALSGTDLRVQLLLYTRENPNCSERLIEHNVTASEYLNTSKKIVFVIHGFRPTGSPPAWLGDIKELLLSSEDINLIIVDWNRGATTVNYITAVVNSRKVAEILKNYIDQMLVRQRVVSVLNKFK